MTQTRHLLLSLWLCAACCVVTVDARAELDVLTTTTDLADLVGRVGGDHVAVEALCKANQDPHYVQTRPSLMVKLRRAELVVAVGLDLESGWLPFVLRGARNPSILPGAQGFLSLEEVIQPLDIPASVDASQGHVHARGNPHYWLDPVRMVDVVGAIASRLSKLAPEHSATFEANAHAYVATLRAKIAAWEQRMATYRGTEVLSYHDTFNYFYARYGLVNVGTLENKPGVPPSPRHLARVIATAKARKVPVLFHEAFHDRKPSGLVAERSGATLLVLPASTGAVSGAESYVALIDTLVTRFVAAMEAR
jgi:zinc/manganese transport system substrate-binding protein